MPIAQARMEKSFMESWVTPHEVPGSISEQSMARLRPVAERLLELPGPTQKL